MSETTRIQCEETCVAENEVGLHLNKRKKQTMVDIKSEQHFGERKLQGSLENVWSEDDMEEYHIGYTDFSDTGSKHAREESCIVVFSGKQTQEFQLPFSRHKIQHAVGLKRKYALGRNVEIRRFCGYNVKKDDWVRLSELEDSLREQNTPEIELQEVMCMEVRRAVKALSREKNKVCFHCKQPNHLLSECPVIANKKFANDSDFPRKSGICLKCGSTEHSRFNCNAVQQDEYKFARCFTCGKQGHISRQCPNNSLGLYPLGGSCNKCGDQTHFGKDCPKRHLETVSTVPTHNDVKASEVTSISVPPKTE